MPRKKKPARKKLTKRQTDALARHGKNHTSRHMAVMRQRMRAGSTLAAAHRAATNEVGR